MFPPQGSYSPAGGRAEVKSRQVKIGRMAVDEAWRRRGVGGRILAALEVEARRMGMREAVLAAQTRATRFYESHGYGEEGAVFLDAGIDHILMRKRL